MRQVRTFQVGDVLRTAIAVYGQNLRTLVVLALVTHLPLFVLIALHPMPDPPAIPPPESAEDGRAFLSVLLPQWRVHYASMIWYSAVDSFCGVWIQGSVVYVVVRALRSSPPTLAQASWQSWLTIPRVVVVAVLSGLAVAAGMLLLIVPGIIVALMLWVAIPVAVVERRYGSALRRSHELTLGHKVPILGIAILLGVFGFACVMVLSAIVSDLAPRFGPFTDALVTAAATSFSAVVTAVCYHDLRVLKAGADTAVAKVFE